jgi:phosphatidylinositol kinase/protein kinase (PI-3  family)
VDFNCIFEKGLQFNIPERVPFRLTHNMTDAFGVTGYKGAFVRSCEICMRVLRANREGLLCVLETLVHDPLVEWTKRKEKSKAGDDFATTVLAKIEQKLNGEPSHGTTLSIDGQVAELIEQATDVNNLCRMFVGWASHI